MERKELLQKAKERLTNMNFEYEFYKALANKTNIIQYQTKAQRLEADIIELSDEISRF